VPHEPTGAQGWRMSADGVSLCITLAAFGVHAEYDSFQPIEISGEMVPTGPRRGSDAVGDIAVRYVPAAANNHGRGHHCFRLVLVL
jgi:hypothetical protein